MMLVLDLDGVVLDAVAADLKRGVPVAFNTGRSAAWVRDIVHASRRGRVPTRMLDQVSNLQAAVKPLLPLMLA